MKYLLSGLLISCVFCSSAFAQNAGGYDYVPSPVEHSSEVSWPSDAPPVAQSGNGLPWQQGSAQIQPQGNGLPWQQPAPQVNPPSSTSTGGVTSTVQDLANGANSLGNTVQGTMQKVNNINNSVRAFNGNGIPMGGRTMQGMQQVNTVQQYVQGGQRVLGGNGLTAAQQQAILRNRQGHAAGRQVAQNNPFNGQRRHRRGMGGQRGGKGNPLQAVQSGLKLLSK